MVSFVISIGHRGSSFNYLKYKYQKDSNDLKEKIVSTKLIEIIDCK